MAAQAKRTLEMARRIAKLRAQERAERSGLRRCGIWLVRWVWMLFHEYIRDSVKIRAEALAYLSLFSLLPLLAGCFFIFTVLAQFGMVQDALQGLLSTFLSNIPTEHREFVNDYVMKFQQSYLETIHEKSGTIGVFALLILGYVGLQAFNTIDTTLNDIWASDIERPLLEKVRNFIVIAVVAPIVLIAGFSIPLILMKIPATKFILENLPFLRILLNTFIPFALLISTFYVMYRYVPVVRVSWKAALAGSVFSTVMFALTNVLMRVYFSFFTNSAYGKLAAVPLVAFWMFVVWMVVILGAEVSFLFENQTDIVTRAEQSPTLAEARGVVAVLCCVEASFIEGEGPISWKSLLEKTLLGADSLLRITEFLTRHHWIADVNGREGTARSFLPAQDLSSVQISEILSAFLQHDESKVKSRWTKEWEEALETLIASFGKQTVFDFASKNPVSTHK